jgi:hypothetical protein
MLKAPYAEELLRVARKVVWYDRPEETLGDVKTFLAHLMVYGSPADLRVVERYVTEEEFRQVLAEAPAGVFTEEAWKRWHERFGMAVSAMPRRRFPDGSVGPEAPAGSSVGRIKPPPQWMGETKVPEAPCFQQCCVFIECRYFVLRVRGLS